MYYYCCVCMYHYVCMCVCLVYYCVLCVLSVSLFVCVLSLCVGVSLCPLSLSLYVCVSGMAVCIQQGALAYLAKAPAVALRTASS